MMLLVLALAACSVKSRQESIDEWLRCSGSTKDSKVRGC
jgi:hypothetical protein